ncbi:hypothetical protein BaRGS_00037451, partial [Batillaria attramentaria]
MGFTTDVKTFDCVHVANTTQQYYGEHGPAILWPRCFSYNCPHHEMLLQNCIQGTWECQTGEYCEIGTHTSHGNAPYHLMDCRPADTMADCLAAYAGNDAACDPDKHERVCRWCCESEACVQGLAAGNYTSSIGPPSDGNVTA